MAALQGLMLSTRAEPGCVGCLLSTEMTGQIVIQYVEDWVDEPHLAQQLRSIRFATLAELMERASEPPVVEFSLPGATRGLDYAVEIRSSADLRG